MLKTIIITSILAIAPTMAQQQPVREEALSSKLQDEFNQQIQLRASLIELLRENDRLQDQLDDLSSDK